MLFIRGRWGVDGGLPGNRSQSFLPLLVLSLGVSTTAHAGEGILSLEVV